MSRSALSFAVFLAVVLSILGGMHAYLWLRLVRDPGLPEPWRRIGTVLLALLALAIPVGMFSVRIASGWAARWLPVAAFTWLGLAFILFCAVAAIDLARMSAQLAIFVGDWLRQVPDPPMDPDRRMFVARAMAGGAVIAAGGSAALAFRSATGPAEIHEVAVRLERLPPALSGLTIAQISDLHVGPAIREREVRRVVEQTNALRPDVVAITGDLVDGSVRELGHAVAELARLQARHGVFFVTGNHEYYSGVDAWVAELRRLGIRVLRNERVSVGDAGASIDLAGVDDWSSGQFGNGHGMDLPRALDGRDPERSLVLLAHQPRAIGEAVRSGVELQLSGHTHGGQIFPFNLLVRAAYPYVKGLYPHAEGNTRGQIFVSRGTGYWGPPMRLGSPPEIAKIVLT
ncbi:metallophosphoesterase [Anaeromyxobacter sp. PSR-1]|uniref:metallophosphoesterase n=1 Tax=Anaeromyxobacter sp. PSR-1 TaxID=1300915 RepID=UPI0005E38206|nr:metallophosphoesterase [Anaeromyxobacter sp. PSR-1]GAO04523.1 transmembrane protein with metallophosphoesterase domain [Anaeromyxobacter sp. PSR-1]